MGTTPGAILRVFIMIGLTIGIIGDLLGFVLGTIVCLNVESIRQFMSWLTNTEIFRPEIYFLSRLPAEMDAGETVAVIVMTVVVAFIATIYPAWQAGRIDPTDALHG